MNYSTGQRDAAGSPLLASPAASNNGSVSSEWVSPGRHSRRRYSGGGGGSGSGSTTGGQHPMTAVRKFSRYLTRLFRFSHMDFQFAGWQMIYLFTNPKQVFRNSQYRKQTKDQFARDDPAFLVLLGMWLLISATGLSVVLRLPIFSAIKFLFWVVFVDTIAVGLLVAAGTWLVANLLLRRPRGIAPGRPVSRSRPPSEQIPDVEFGYCFDVHLNAFFPPLMILHVFQLLFFNLLISGDSFLARLFGNSLFLIACGYYVYITFLGFNSLTFLHDTRYILWPLVPLALFYLVTLISGLNICRIIMDFYHYRVY